MGKGGGGDLVAFGCWAGAGPGVRGTEPRAERTCQRRVRTEADQATPTAPAFLTPLPPPYVCARRGET